MFKVGDIVRIMFGPYSVDKPIGIIEEQIHEFTNVNGMSAILYSVSLSSSIDGLYYDYEMKKVELE